MIQRPSAVDELVLRAGRRQLAALIVDEACRAAAAVFLFLALLLVTGVGIFHPGWVAVPVALAAAWTGWRVWRRRPDPYCIAQAADRALGMRDLLATAWYLRRQGVPPAPLVPIIVERAESACAGADVRRAVPLWRWSRPATAAVAAFALAAALFVLRVGILRRFELRAPLVAVQFDPLTGAPAPPRPQPRAPAKKLDLPGFHAGENALAFEEDPFPAEALRTMDAQNVAAPAPEGLRQTASGRARTQGDTNAERENAAPDADSAEPEDASDNPGDSGAAQERTSPPPKSDSLLDRMRDALANLMDKFKLELPPGDGSRTTAQNQARKESAQRERGQPQPGRKGEPGREGEMQTGQQQAADSSQQAKSEQAGRPDA
ncbi:MAG: hypothetical protein ACPL7M_11335, partial [Bryobacteraceae bacterium]